MNDTIIYEGTIADYPADVQEILLPFFRRIWEECGLSRPDYLCELNNHQLKHELSILAYRRGPRKGPLGSSCRLTSISLPLDPETTTNTQLHEGSSPPSAPIVCAGFQGFPTEYH